METQRLNWVIHLAPRSYKRGELVATQRLSRGIHLANSSSQVGVYTWYMKRGTKKWIFKCVECDK